MLSPNRAFRDCEAMAVLLENWLDSDPTVSNSDISSLSYT